MEGSEAAPDSLREEPIGVDIAGNRYFFFSGAEGLDCRLYMEEPPGRKQLGKRGRTPGAPWKTVCTSLEEMTGFLEKLSTSRHKAEKELHGVVADDILPQLVEATHARRKAEEKAALLEAMPRKRSNRIQVGTECCRVLPCYPPVADPTQVT